jgi:hypothetical chaperone protein
MTLPTIATPETKTLLDEIIATSPDACRVNNLRSLIFNEYGFSFYSTVEEAKIRLSEDYATAVDFRTEDIEVWQMLTRLQFERILQPYLDSVYELLINTLLNAGLEASEIDRVITTGGSSSIPVFNRMLEEMFGAKKVLPTSAFTSVTAGLAIKAHQVFA